MFDSLTEVFWQDMPLRSGFGCRLDRRQRRRRTDRSIREEVGLFTFASHDMNMALGIWGSNVLPLATARTHGGSWVMSASALLASTIVATFGLTGLAFVASRKGYQVLAAFLAAVVWLSIGMNYLIWRWSYHPKAAA